MIVVGRACRTDINAFLVARLESIGLLQTCPGSQKDQTKVATQGGVKLRAMNHLQVREPTQRSEDREEIFERRTVQHFRESDPLILILKQSKFFFAK